MPFFNLLGRFFSLVAALALVVFLFVKYPQILTAMFDMNLNLIKSITSQLNEPYAGQFQLGLRFINAERALVLVEIIALIKLLLWGLVGRFRH